MLDAGADPNIRNVHGEGVIFTAIRWNHPEVITLLSQRGCRINELNNDGMTPLAVAVHFKSPELVKALLACDVSLEVSGVSQEQLREFTEPEKPAPVDPMAPQGTASAKKKNVRVAETKEIAEVFDIVANNQFQALQERIRNGIDPNSRSIYTNESLLHAAVSYGAAECVRILIKAGADVNAQTALYQESPLHVAIQEGFFDIFFDLIRNNADVESQNCEGEGPLFTAVKYDRVEMFRVLVRKGSDVNKINFGGLAPIHFAVMDGNEFLTDSLLYHGADPALGNLNPYTYAFRAGEKKIAYKLEIVSPMLAKATKLNPNIFKAIKEDNVEQLNKFIIKGFDINLIDVLEGSPLHCAVEHRSEKCMKLLIENEANLNIRSIQRHETPVQIAIRRNYDDIYNYLVGLNVDLSLKNKEVFILYLRCYISIFMKMPSSMPFVKIMKVF